MAYWNRTHDTPGLAVRRSGLLIGRGLIANNAQTALKCAASGGMLTGASIQQRGLPQVAAAMRAIRSLLSAIVYASRHVTA